MKTAFQTPLKTMIAFMIALTAVAYTAPAQAGAGAKMRPIERGPVQPKLLKAALNYKKSGRIRSKTSWACIPPQLKSVLGEVAAKFGAVTINSSGRSKAHNRRVGGKKSSFHIGCNAVDFSVHGRKKGLTAYLRRHKLVGGYKYYRKTGHFHIDTGPKRTW